MREERGEVVVQTKVPLSERALGFSLALIHLYRNIQDDPVGRILGRQILRSGTSIGANIAEAQGGQSRADFVTKISIAHKESLETEYWLRLLQASRLGPAQIVAQLADEARQFSRILSSSILTARGQARQQSAVKIPRIRSR